MKRLTLLNNAIKTTENIAALYMTTEHNLWNK